jgi:hypothetical protein
LFFPVLLRVLKCGFLFDERKDLTVTGHSPSNDGDPSGHSHSLTCPLLHARTHARTHAETISRDDFRFMHIVRRLHIVEVMSVCPSVLLFIECFNSRTAGRIFIKFDMNIMRLEATRNLYILNFLQSVRSRDSAVGIATGYGLDDLGVGVRVPVGSRIFCSPHLPNRLWGPPSLLSNGYRWLFPQW